MTAGWGETEVLMDVSSRRLARVLHRLLAEHGLLSFLSLLRAFCLNVIKRNRDVAAAKAHRPGSARRLVGRHQARTPRTRWGGRDQGTSATN